MYRSRRLLPVSWKSAPSRRVKSKRNQAGLRPKRHLLPDISTRRQNSQPHSRRGFWLEGWASALDLSTLEAQKALNLNRHGFGPQKDH